MSLNGEPTIHDVLDAVNTFATRVEERFNGIDQRFDGVDQRFDGVDQRFDGVDQRFDGVDQRFEGIDQRLNRIESTMVTKDYLDDKLADLRGDFVVLMRKEDHKWGTLLGILRGHDVITEDEAKRVLSMEPFPQLAL